MLILTMGARHDKDLSSKCFILELSALVIEVGCLKVVFTSQLKEKQKDDTYHINSNL